MSAQCASEFVNKYCTCLPDPVEAGSTICGYINRQNGLVYPCDVGCCQPACVNPGRQPPQNVELRKSKGTTLPPGFNVNLAHSDRPSDIPGATPLAAPTNFYTPPPSKAQGGGGGPAPEYKVWNLFLLMFVLLAIIVMMVMIAA